MCHQTGHPPFTESESASLEFLCARDVGCHGREVLSGTRGLPSFVSSEPPRSEGEALLRRIFSRGEAV